MFPDVQMNPAAPERVIGVSRTRNEEKNRRFPRIYRVSKSKGKAQRRELWVQVWIEQEQPSTFSLGNSEDPLK